MTERESETPRRGMLPPTYFALCWFDTIILHLVIPVHQLIPWPYRWAGIIPFVLASWITIWADRIFKLRHTTVKPHLDPSVLVTDGPFRFSRHPMYLGMTLVLIGVAVLCGSLTAFLGPLTFAVIMQMAFIPTEERALSRVFGKRYTAYRLRVRAWL